MLYNAVQFTRASQTVWRQSDFPLGIWSVPEVCSTQKFYNESASIESILCLFSRIGALLRQGATAASTRQAKQVGSTMLPSSGSFFCSGPLLTCHSNPWRPLAGILCALLSCPAFDNCNANQMRIKLLRGRREHAATHITNRLQDHHVQKQMALLRLSLGRRVATSA